MHLALIKRWLYGKRMIDEIHSFDAVHEVAKLVKATTSEIDEIKIIVNLINNPNINVFF